MGKRFDSGVHAVLTTGLLLAVGGYAFADNAPDLQLTPQVSGLPSPIASNVQTRLTTAIADLPQPLDPDAATSFYEQSDDTVVAGITPYGYFSPTVDKQVHKQPHQWLLQYQVEPGPLSHITVIDIRLQGMGAQEPALQHLLQQAPFHEQQGFSSESYEAYKEQLMETANQLGYIQAVFSDHRVLVDRTSHSIEIHLTLDTQQRYYFGQVTFSPNPLNPVFLQRFVPFNQQQVFNNDKLNQLQTNLNNSGYFQHVEATPQLQTDSEHVPIQVDAQAKPRQQYILGAGYGTDTGPRLSLGSHWNYVTDMGHQFMTMARLSQVQSTLISKYTIPGYNPLEDQYTLNGSLLTNNINQGSSQTRQLGVGYSHNHDGWQRNLNLSYQIEHYSFNNDPYQTSHLLLPSLNYQKKVSDNPLFPTRGNNFSFLIQGAKQGVLADTNFIQGRLQEKWLYPLTEQSQLLLKTDLGYTAIHDQNLLPLSLSFFAGGAQSVRGYGYNSLGPGRYLVVASAEYRHQIVEKWYGATFMDMGNAFDNLPSGGQGGLSSKMAAVYQLLERGVGVGVGWNSPVGPMQLSLAKAVTAAGMPNRIQFDIGTTL